MDYCSTCRRHLNGALVCPGCGAYAPDIAPAVIGGRTVPGPATAAASEAVAPPPAPRPASVSASTSTGTGRAARRRQLVRWKKTQRRALVATAVAFVGGGLTLASLDRGGTDRAQAATAPDLRGMGGAEEPADQYDEPDVPASSPDRTDPSPSADDRRGRADAEAAPEPAAPSDARTDTATAPETAAPSQPRTTSPAPVSRSGSRSDTEPERESVSGSGSGSSTVTPPPATGSGDGDGGTDQEDGSQSTPSVPTTPSTPPAAEPDSERLCLLVICLG
ncbi:SCO2400 family protein [Streptomyces sp. SAI-229]|uniref:SCO2400 family protein n=1 Tax=Streptomyces sp. SAI-229 TaxID=3377731 RepID=UPI003C7C5368